MTKEALLFDAREKWSKPFHLLPVAIDLPRFAKKIEIYRNGERIWCASQVDSEKGIQEFIVQILCILSRQCENEELLKKITSSREEFFRDENTDTGKELRKYFEYLGCETKVMKILKVCNQSAVAAAYLRLKGIISQKFPFKDSGSWKILIFFSNTRITVRHIKKEQGLNEGAHMNFEWQYDMHFDSEMKELKSVCLSIVDIRYESSEIIGVKQLALEKFLRGFNLSNKLI